MKRNITTYICCLILTTVACNNEATTPYHNLYQADLYKPISDSILADEHNAALYTRRAMLLAQQSETNAALANYAEAYHITKQQQEGAQYATALVQYSRLDTALTVLTTLRTQYPSNVYLHSLLAEVHAARKEYTKAIATYRAVLAQDSTVSNTWLYLSYCYQEVGNDAAAIQALERAYGLQPNITAGYELAAMYAAKGNPRTISLCKELAVLSAKAADKDVRSTYFASVYYTTKGNTTLALQLLDSCIAQDYTYGNAYIDKATLLLQANNIPGAIQVLTLAQQNDNTNPEAYYYMGKCYQAQGRLAAARLEYQKAIALDKEYTLAAEALKGL